MAFKVRLTYSEFKENLINSFKRIVAERPYLLEEAREVAKLLSQPQFLDERMVERTICGTSIQFIATGERLGIDIKKMGRSSSYSLNDGCDESQSREWRSGRLGKELLNALE